MRKYLVIIVFLYFVSINAEDGKKEKDKDKKVGKVKDGRKPSGKKISINEKGDIGITISRRKWGDESKSRTLCCPLAGKHCKYPCKGMSCSAQCTLSCGLFSLFSCAPVSCGAANPFQCVAASTCPSGWTVSGQKCFRVFPGPSNWLASLQTCIALGGTLAKIESQAENDLVHGLLGTTSTTPAYIGLADFLKEGTFTWADGSALGTYGFFTPGPDTPGPSPPWQNLQPNNGVVNGVSQATTPQDCVVLRPSDMNWNDVICGKENRFVCQRTAA